MHTDICENRHKGNENSRAAFKQNQFHFKKDREDILDLIADCSTNGEGITCLEIEDCLAMKHQTCSARISELKRDKLIRIIGRRNGAAVYVCVN